ncbi:MAG: conserved membrane protein of unknown function [Anaerolineales bacterium]|nr:conserved membrane protein of unknown function [Anaerolineales bacterium]
MQRLLAVDKRWTQALRLQSPQRGLRTAAAILAHSGDSWFWGAGLVLLIWRGDADQRSWALQLLLAIAGLAAVVLTIKFIFRRRRPQGEWGSIYRMTDPHSFPSGHAARAFLIAARFGGGFGGGADRRVEADCFSQRGQRLVRRPSPSPPTPSPPPCWLA